MRHRSASLLAIVGLAAFSKAQAAEYLDLAPFGRMTTDVNGGLRTTTIEWDDERDVREIRGYYVLRLAAK